MTLELAVRLLATGLIALVLAWEAICAFRDESAPASPPEEEPRTLQSGGIGTTLPWYLILLAFLLVLLRGPANAMGEIFSLCFSLFLHISVYYALLLPLMPRLRRHISARTCAMLWLLPNYLSLFVIWGSKGLSSAPKWVLRPPKTLIWVLFFLWLAGFAAVLAGKIVSHLAFRRRILRQAVSVTDPDLLALWDEEWARLGVKPGGCRLVRSPAVTTPLSVGLFRRCIRVVLPDRPYAPEELTLILRHELTHVAREDAWAKFFLVFCTAMCWFNPLMWHAMRRSAEDLELSCDEAVLRDADEAQRQRYASLILSTAGDERGFTTCLSASAEALRYRLKSVVQPRRLHSGALTTALIFLLLSMSFGYVSLAYASGTGENLLFHGNAAEEVTLQYSDPDAANIYDLALCHDEAAVCRYLSSLTLDSITGGSPALGSGRRAMFRYRVDGEDYYFTLYDRALLVQDIHGESITYYLADGADWGYLDSLYTVFPDLTVSLCRDDGRESDTLHATLAAVRDSSGALLYENDEGPDAVRGIFGGSLTYETATFAFDAPSAGSIRVTAERWDGTSSYTVALAPGESYRFPAYSAHYTVCAPLLSADGTVLEAEYRFDLGQLDDDGNVC